MMIKQKQEKSGYIFAINKKVEKLQLEIPQSVHEDYIKLRAICPNIDIKNFSIHFIRDGDLDSGMVIIEYEIFCALGEFITLCDTMEKDKGK